MNVTKTSEGRRPLRGAARWALTVVAIAISMLTAFALLPSEATAETPAERCKRETAAYNTAWSTAWMRTHPGARPSDAPPPPVPYRCGQNGEPPTLSPGTSTPPSSTAPPSTSETAKPNGDRTGPSAQPSTERDEPASGVDRDQPSIGTKGRMLYPDIPKDELRKLINISVRNFDTEIRKLRSGLQDFARQMSLPYSKVLASSERNALEAVQVNSSADDACGKPANREVGVALRRGDFFYSDSCTKGINHGHNGIFVTAKDTMEASDEKGVHYVTDAASTRRLNPQKYYVNADQATSQQKDAAADYALSKKGKGYNSAGFANNRQGGPDVGHFNCSQLVWAAYYEPSRIDLDKDSYGSFIGRMAPNPGVYPTDLTGSPLVTPY